MNFLRGQRISRIPGLLEQEARKIAEKYHLSDSEKAFFLDFVSEKTLEILEMADDQREKELQERELKLSSPVFNTAFSELKRMLCSLVQS